MYPQKWITNIMRVLTARYQDKAYSEKETPWRSLVFTVLSARTRDEQTEVVYQKLIKNYPTPHTMALASYITLAGQIKTIGLYRNKAKNLVLLARALVENHGGRVPNDFDALLALPGVGRKTANCVMVYAFRKPAMCVDTHVHRVTNRLGWVRQSTPEKTEQALRVVVPKRLWLHLNRVMVQFGRTICVAQKPKCWICPVRKWCKYPKKNLNYTS